jgi:2-keto-4-pentenoate hydratase
MLVVRMGSAADRVQDGPLGLTPREHRRLADVLLAAADRRRPIEPLTRRYPELTLGDACRIRDVVLARRVVAGEHLIAAKASPAAAGGIALLTNGMLHASGPIVLEGLIHPRVEAKVAFRLSGPLAGPRVSTGDVLAAIDRVLPALEVLDSRFGTLRLEPADDVADNCAAAILHVGDGAAPPAEPDLDGFAWRFTVTDGNRRAASEPRASGTAAPLAPIVALAQQLIDAGRAPDAGTLLLAPGSAPPVALLDGTRVSFTCEGLGEVELHATRSFDPEGDEREH